MQDRPAPHSDLTISPGAIAPLLTPCRSLAARLVGAPDPGAVASIARLAAPTPRPATMQLAWTRRWRDIA